jgi:hypothetical protein
MTSLWGDGIGLFFVLVFAPNGCYGEPHPNVHLSASHYSGQTGSYMTTHIGFSSSSADLGYYPFVDLIFPGWDLAEADVNQIHPLSGIEAQFSSSDLGNDSPLSVLQLPPSCDVDLESCVPDPESCIVHPVSLSFFTRCPYVTSCSNRY